MRRGAWCESQSLDATAESTKGRMMNWISIKDELPPQGIKIKIKAQYEDCCVEAEAVFKIYDIDEETEAWGWSLSQEDLDRYGTLRPTHWMPLPELSEEK